MFATIPLCFHRDSGSYLWAYEATVPACFHLARTAINAGNTVRRHGLTGNRNGRSDLQPTGG
jgi:hypothetical protein